MTLFYHECLRLYGDRILMKHDLSWTLPLAMPPCYESKKYMVNQWLDLVHDWIKVSLYGKLWLLQSRLRRESRLKVVAEARLNINTDEEADASRIITSILHLKRFYRDNLWMEQLCPLLANILEKVLNLPMIRLKCAVLLRF